jgi:ATP-binding cassette subfamily B protein
VGIRFRFPETFLLFRSVADNIRYGSFDADREEVIAAAKAARAHEFIEDLEDGYDTEDRTVLAIAHRLSTIKDADEILVLEDGAVVERGTHDELVARGGLYAKLWGVQAGQIENALPDAHPTV